MTDGALGDILSSKCPNASMEALRSLDDRLQVEVYILESPQYIGDLLGKEFRVRKMESRTEPEEMPSTQV